MEGTSLTYASPAFFSSLRQSFEKLNELANDKEHEQDDRFIATTFINFLLPKNVRGEGSVTTNTKDGTLTISNSAHSHKSSLATGLASPLFTIAGFTVGQVGQALEARERVMQHKGEAHAEEVIRAEDEDFDKIGD